MDDGIDPFSHGGLPSTAKKAFITRFRTFIWLPTTVIQYRNSRVPAAVLGAGAF